MIKFIIISPYLFLFYEGIFCIINSVICILLEYLIVINLPDDPLKNEDKNYFINNFLEIITIFLNQEKEKGHFYIYFFLMFILSFVYYILSTLSIYNFTPYLIIIVETCLPIDTDMIEKLIGIQNIFNEEEVYKRVLFQCIGYTIIIFAALILNEIIILNFFGLNKNIHLRIASRGKLDYESFFGFNYSNESEIDDIYSIDENDNEI